MAVSVFSQTKIAGVCCALPKNEVHTADEAARLGIASPGKIISMTGIEKRRVVPPSMCASDLCEAAAAKLLDSLGWEKSTVEALIFVSQTPDYILPATACDLHRRLGLAKTAAAFDVNLGCSGYVYGLWLASSLVESGLTRVLLLVGDTISKLISPEDKATVFLFGDSGSATALERKPGRLVFVLGTDGSGVPHLIVPAGQAREPRDETSMEVKADESGNRRGRHQLYMNGPEVMSFTLREVPPMFDQLLQHSGVGRDQVDAVVMHQANQFLLDALTKKMGIPKERVPSSLSCYGNTSCGSIPVTFTKCLGRDLVESTRCVAMMGFGVGWSWAGCIGDFGPMVLPNFLEI